MSGVGGSLGLRTPSYGSLQQQQLQGEGAVTVSIPAGTEEKGRIIGRKSSKMSLSGGREREKEKVLQKICKIAGRRGVGMLLLLLVAVAVLMSVLVSICKDEDVPDIDDLHHSRHELSDIVNESTPSKLQEILTIAGIDVERIGNGQEDNYTLPSNISVNEEKTIQPPAPVISSNVRPPEQPHPCANFALPPPPADKKRIGPRPCPVCYLPVDQAISSMPRVPSPSPVMMNLTYVYEESSARTEPYGGSEFGGYPSLERRNQSFDIEEQMNVHCGFVKGSKPGRQTGFDIDKADLLEMEQCNGVVVASAIFGNYDIIQQPKNISEAAKKEVCFYMFVDEDTEAYMKNTSTLDDRKKVGLWRVIVVHNLPYKDARRNGKIPKLLLHRIFPNARFSLWIDGKLELVVDPYQILERFLWRNNASFAISRHYKRFDVFQEAEANKAAGKYSNASIDNQIEFYKREGLTPYSSAKFPITSDVPEGCVIIKEHIPITNLFTCLWFNEVDRFTSRDQISFAIVRDKIMSKVNWSVNMFLDCERRNFVIQGYHRDILEHRARARARAHSMATVVHPLPPPPPPPPAVIDETVGKYPPTRNEQVEKAKHDTIMAKIGTTLPSNPGKRRKERRSSSRRHRKTGGITDG